jgi:peptide deformylase
MIRPVIRDTFILSRPSAKAGKEDLQTAIDLRDTLAANREICVGMAANMIGVSKRIIAVAVFNNILIMFNPVIVSKKGQYTAEEGCLSLPGMRQTTRYKTVTVRFTDMTFAQKTMVFSGPAAQIIQHECDHLEGILI